MAVVRKTNFIGGLNQQLDPTKLDPQQDFYLVLNGRTRRGVIDPIKAPADITAGLPATGKLQGIYAADSILLAFISGAAYYRDYANADNGWTPISGYTMNADTDRVYCEMVPASTVNYARKLNTDGNVRGVVSLSLDTPTLLSPQCVIVMDGVSQPCVIFADGTARVTQNYSQWTLSKSGMEYVPIGILPLFFNNKLYCVGRGNNGHWNQIFHSASGQPLNFMVAITKTGDKTASSELEGGAPVTAGGFSFADITSLRAINSAEGFFGSTARASVLIKLDYNNTQFFEPTFTYQPLFSIGALNDQCVTDTLGDVAVIHYNGIRSFNGVMTTKWEGRNSPFSAKINALTDGIIQDYACCASFDNYNGFALMTKHGPGILWYDTLVERFVSLDIYPGVAQIKQFAEIKTANAQRLFFSTVDDKLYEAFAGKTANTCGVYFIDLMPQNAAPSMHRITTVNCAFTDIQTEGFVQCEVYHNKVKAATQTQKILPTTSSPGQFTAIPYNPTTDDDTAILNFSFQATADYAWRAGALLTWDAQATLLEITLETDEQIPPSTNRDTARVEIKVNPTSMIFVGDDGLIAPERIGVFAQMLQQNADFYIGLGDHAYTAGTHNQVAGNFKAYWEKMRRLGRFFATPGNHDIDTNNGDAFFTFMQQPPTNYFSTMLGEFVELFVCIDGLNTAGAQVFPFNTGSPDISYSQQFQWLKSALAASTAKFKFVIWHEPPYTSGTTHNPRVDLQAIPLKQWGAHALFCGHNHNYERIVRDGFTYYIVGTGGSPLYNFNATPDTGSCARIKNCGYLKAKIHPLSAEFKFVDINNVEHDAWIIRP